MEIERRTFSSSSIGIERRAASEGGDPLPVIIGHPSVFNQWTDIGGWFQERVAPGAFSDSILEDDIRALFNHDANIVLGRNKAKTLRLSEDEHGLRMEIDPPDTQAARDLVVSLERGDISGGSIGFWVLKQEWDESTDILKRTILKASLFDVSPVTFPAFPQTDVGLRSLPQGIPAEIAQRLQLRRSGGLNTEKAASIRRNRRQSAYRHAF